MRKAGPPQAAPRHRQLRNHPPYDFYTQADRPLCPLAEGPRVLISAVLRRDGRSLRTACERRCVLERLPQSFASPDGHVARYVHAIADVAQCLVQGRGRELWYKGEDVCSRELQRRLRLRLTLTPNGPSALVRMRERALSEPAGGTT